jgi:DNA-binding SARP family transcriptional activator/pimeloyl-ACP methyl ester carboxylesterase
VRYLVLGPLAVRTEAGEPVLPRGRKQRLLLATLVRHAPRVASIDRLVDALWGARPPARPGAALQTEVSRLRALLRTRLGAAPIESEPHGYRLAVAPEDVDATHFAGRVAAERDARTPEEALAGLDAALALWRGEPYEEFADVQAFVGEITRLCDLRTGALERRAELLLALGRPAEAVATVEPIVRQDPLRERPRALQMEALYRAGRSTEALAVFQEYRRRLAEELGLEPSPAIRQLEVEIIRHERALGRDSRAPAPPDGLRGPLLRVAFLDRAGVGRLAYAEAGAGRPLLVLPAWVSNLAAIGSGSDPRAALLAEVADRCRLILYDRLGMGLSSGSHVDWTVERGVEEALAVLDAAGVERAALLAISQAGPVALTLAARHPERVTRLLLVGTYACGPRTFPDPAVRASVIALIRAHWGLGSRLLADLILPGASPEEVQLFARVQRAAATPASAAAAIERLYAADVDHLLRAIPHPARVIHYTDDPAIPFRGGEEIARGLPNAHLVPLAGRAHLPRGADAARVATLVADFVG